MSVTTKPRPATRRVVPTVDYTRIVNALQRVRADIKALEADEKHLKQQLIDGGARSYSGTTVNALVHDVIQVKLDVPAIRADMGPEWVDAHSKPVTVTQVRLEAKLAA